jgi:ABC-type polysaccharide/polyol phosphate export permease
LWAYRELIGFLALRDIKSRYKQVFLGATWTVVQPLAGMVALVLVFRRLVHVPSDGLPYASFALVGYAMWSYVSDAVTSLSGSLLANSELVTKVYFPRIVAPVAALLPGLLDLALSLVAVAAVMAAQGVAPPAAIVLLPIVVLFAVLASFAVGIWLATSNVLYRDVGHAVPFLLQLWFFASPVAYPSDLVNGSVRWVYALNPIVGVIDASRAVILGAPLHATNVVVSLASMVVAIAAGIVWFQRLERRFADVI